MDLSQFMPFAFVFSLNEKAAIEHF